ncbi:hypothetical protein DFH27DRAFT_527759 [Peziza echinospora]|nr:hypothetical protein DFH27DRAFT_527759 [Peziza echinospora]
MRQSMGNTYPSYAAHSRNVSTASNTAPSMMMMTPPMSPPSAGAPNSTTTAAAAVSSMGPPPPRYPNPAHLNLSPMSPPYSRPVIAPNTRTSVQEQQAFNPYAYQIPENGVHNPPEYAFHPHSFDIASDPASPIFPPLHPAFPLAGGDESLFDRWLRHEAMGRPMYPASRTGSSVATSDISSVRGGMFGSLPGGRSIADERIPGGGSSRAGPGSVVSAATRDRDNFTSSAPSYPSSRTGGSRPPSRDGDVRSVTGESYAPSVISSDVYPPSIDTRLQFQHQNAPPNAPTPPTTSMASGSSYEPSMFERDDASTDNGLPNSPMPAATRPPRYSAATDPALYRSYLADLLNNGAVGYQTSILPLSYGGTSENEKATLAAKMMNPEGHPVGSGLIVVQEEVWQELRRLAGLEGMTVAPNSSTPSSSSSSSSNITRTPSSSSRNMESEMNEKSRCRTEVKRRRRGSGSEEEKEAGCCGCVIC